MADGILPIARYFVREGVENISKPPGIPPKSRKKSTLCGPRYRRAGETVIYLLVIRPEFRAALARLKALGIWAMMLTDHATAVARWAARELALDEFLAEVLPD